jgi:hypothetical protein
MDKEINKRVHRPFQIPYFLVLRSNLLTQYVLCWLRGIYMPYKPMGKLVTPPFCRPIQYGTPQPSYGLIT